MREDLIKRIVERITLHSDSEWNMNTEHFDWVPGVGLFGIFKAFEASKNREWFDYLKAWTERNLQKAYDISTVNSTAPLLTVILMYKYTGDERLIRVCRDIAERIINQAPLTECGGLEHTVTERGEGFKEQIWADTLFMACLFIAELGRIDKNRRYTDFVINQLKIHHRYLKDPACGLYYHGYNCREKSHMSGVRWGRANGWVLFSTVYLLDILGEFDGREEMISDVREQIKTLAKLQRPSGLFGTIIDDEKSYDETSASAALIWGINTAADRGYVSADYKDTVKRGMKGIIGMIRENGEVDGVSTGTPIMKDAEAYRNVPVCPTLYGQALAAAALSDVNIEI